MNKNTMDNLSFAANIAGAVLSDKLDSARQQAEAAAARVQSNVAAGAAKVRQQAEMAAANAASIDISKMASGENLQHLAESGASRLRDSASALGSTVTSVAAGDFSPLGAAAGGAGGPSSSANKAADDGESDSGGEWQDHSGGRFGNLSGVASRLGFASSARSSETQSLMKNDLEKGDGSGGTAGGGGGTFAGSLGGFADGLSVGLRQMRDAGAATATNVGSGLGLVEKKQEPPTGLGRVFACCPNLTKGQRLLGFAICFCFGGLLSLSALNSLPSLLLGNPAPFAFKYTLGNLLSLSSSAFLVGPEKQCRDMLTPERRLASLTYLLTLVGTLVCVFVLRIQLLSFCFIIVQFCALTWYMLSYVPYGQVCLKRIIARVMAK